MGKAEFVLGANVFLPKAKDSKGESDGASGR